MQISTVEIRNVAGTEAAMGWAGGHTIVIDRPEGRAGGLGLGFNGAQLLGLSIGGCFANDLRYVAAEREVSIGEISITVEVALEGDPILAVGAVMRVDVNMADGSDPNPIIERARSISMALNSVSRGLPVQLAGLSPAR